MAYGLSIVPYWAPLISAATTFVLIGWMLRFSLLTLPLDHPNPRSLHETAMPRTGGLAIIAGVLLSAGLLPMDNYWWLIALPPLVAVSFLDDWHGLSPLWRFTTHFLVAGTFVMVALPGLDYFSSALLILAIAWITNLYNFMDGSDGLAGGMTVIGFGFYGLSAWLAHDTSFALINLSVAAAACAFLVFNFPPARIFMGDAGSIPLGFLVATLGLTGWQRELWPLWVPVMVFSPFIVDASVTLIKRSLRREKIWVAHREHYYQRLVRLGLGHRNTALIEYAVMMACGGSMIWALQRPSVQSWLIAGWCLFYVTTLAYIDHLWRKASVEAEPGNQKKN